MSRLTRAIAVAALVAPIVCIGAGATMAAGQAEDDISIASISTRSYPAVTVDVDVPGGSAASRFTANDFAVTENSRPVEVGVTRAIDNGFEVMLLIDTSGSMAGNPITSARRAAVEFVQAMPAETSIGVVSFGGDGVRVLSSPTKEHAAVVAIVGGLQARGDTPLYDAVVAAAASFTPAARTRTMVLLSDGGDEGSTATLGDAVSAASGVQFESIELVTAFSNRIALELLASAGHGHIASAEDPRALSAAYAGVVVALANRYQVSYRSATFGDARIVVRLVTLSGALETSATVVFPTAATTQAAAPAPTAAVPTVLAADASPEPAKVLPTPPVVISADVPGFGWLLLLGAFGIFGAIYSMTFMALPRAITGRVSRRQLGLPTRELPSMSEPGKRATAAIDEYLVSSGRGPRLATALDAAGIPARAGEFVVTVGTIAVAAALLGSVLGGAPFALLLTALVLFGAYAFVDIKANRRRAAFADALPEVLQLLTSTLRSGYGLMQAFEAVAEEAPEPARTLIHEVVIEVRLGRDLTEALRSVDTRMESPDFGWVVTAVEIHREVGGNLAEILANVAATIRDRQKLGRQIRSLTAEGRLSVYILTALPILLGLFLRWRDPTYFSDLTSGGGLVVLATSALLIVVGWVWMRRLLKFKF